MKIHCPYCEEEITNAIKLKRSTDSSLLLTAEYCEDKHRELDVEAVEDEVSEDYFKCGRCNNDITTFLLDECGLWLPY